jgi:hypothetical protein
MLMPDRKPYVPEPREVRGPAVDRWQGEKNNDRPSDHRALLTDKDRRAKIVDRISGNVRHSKDVD